LSRPFFENDVSKLSTKTPTSAQPPTLTASAREHLRRVLIRDQADRDAICKQAFVDGSRVEPRRLATRHTGRCRLRQGLRSIDEERHSVWEVDARGERWNAVDLSMNILVEIEALTLGLPDELDQ